MYDIKSVSRLEQVPFYILEKAIKSYRQLAQRNIRLVNKQITIGQWLILKTIEGNNRYRLIPMANDKFMIKEIPYFRLKILKEGDRVVALQGIFNDGTMDKSMKRIKK